MSGAKRGIMGKWVFSIDRFSRAGLKTLIESVELFHSQQRFFGQSNRPPKTNQKVRKTKKTLRVFIFAQLGAFLGKCALPSTKREGSSGYGGCARMHGRWRRRTALDGDSTLRSYANIPKSREHPLHLERRRIY